jgi:hypothetical protein
MAGGTPTQHCQQVPQADQIVSTQMKIEALQQQLQQLQQARQVQQVQQVQQVLQPRTQSLTGPVRNSSGLLSAANPTSNATINNSHSTMNHNATFNHG